jgi:hypothetical protein
MALSVARFGALALAGPAALATWAMLRAANRPRPFGALAQAALGVAVFAVGAAVGAGIAVVVSGWW